METYLTWFSALIFSAELIVDATVATYYFVTNQLYWGLSTLIIIVVPLILCQIYSLWLLKSEKSQTKSSAICLHLMLCGIPYRHYNILKAIDKDKASNQEANAIRKAITNVNSVQTLNAIFQYCPQFLLQSFLIIYRENKSVVTGMSAGLAAFSLVWHLFIRFYYWSNRYNEEITFDCQQSGNGPVQIIDNLTTSFHETSQSRQSNSPSHMANNFHQPNLTDLKHFEKSIFTTDENNLSSTRHSTNKNTEKMKIFNFNKRKPIYQSNGDISEKHDNSLIFFEFEDSLASSKFDLSAAAPKENASYADDCSMMKKQLAKTTGDEEEKFVSIPGNRNSLLKRKGICSSQEMLYLVDILNDNISPDEVDILAKSLVDMGGDCSLQTESDNDTLDNSKLLEHFPAVIDDKLLLENIDAVIYENQIIFQERIRKNKLTIQNLKIQDQMLSKCMEDMKALPCCEILSIRDYENMCFQNISRQNRGMKHWRNYLHDIDTNNHDNSTVQHSSYYVNTTNTDTLTNSLSDLYINEKALTLNACDRQKSCDNVGSERNAGRRNVRWISKLKTENESNCESLSDDLYIVMDSGAYAIPEKNILVETINSINIDSPVKRGGANSGTNN
ncbi:uncharacterized protein LOC119085604 [Bradysia coprophila]|uniref:uncharacterized protein LOC119085604 n=1 Tax=Bradysia coprophila TaxID=38358 RepID=UPI00187D8029|nr:uncharacterized protein LOC119085604 [Bradysia coprophila]